MKKVLFSMLAVVTFGFFSANAMVDKGDLKVVDSHTVKATVMTVVFNDGHKYQQVIDAKAKKAGEEEKATLFLGSFMKKAKRRMSSMAKGMKEKYGPVFHAAKADAMKKIHQVWKQGKNAVMKMAADTCGMLRKRAHAGFHKVMDTIAQHIGRTKESILGKMKMR